MCIEGRLARRARFRDQLAHKATPLLDRRVQLANLSQAQSIPSDWSGTFDFKNATLSSALQSFSEDTKDATNTAMWGMRRSDRPDCWVNFKAIEGKQAKTETIGNETIWHDIWPSCDLIIEVGKASVTKKIILKDPKHQTTFGFSMSMAPGMSYSVGSFDSYSESHEELRHIDWGVLTVTNARIIFTGDKRSIEIPLDKIITVQDYDNELAIQSRNNKKIMHFSNINPPRRKRFWYLRIGSKEYKELFTAQWLYYLIQGLLSPIERIKVERNRLTHVLSPRPASVFVRTRHS